MWRYYQFDVVWMKKDDLKAAFLMGYSSGVYDGYRITNKKNKAMYTKIANVMADLSESIYEKIDDKTIKSLFPLREELGAFYRDNALAIRVWDRLQ